MEGVELLSLYLKEDHHNVIRGPMQMKRGLAALHWDGAEIQMPTASVLVVLTSVLSPTVWTGTSNAQAGQDWGNARRTPAICWCTVQPAASNANGIGR